MKTVETIKRDHEGELRQLRQKHEEEIRQMQGWQELEIQIAEEFGGFIEDRQELADYLGVSMPRISVLIRDGRIREGRFGISMADATRYRDNRRPGRPSYWAQLEKG